MVDFNEYSNIFLTSWDWEEAMLYNLEAQDSEKGKTNFYAA
jgi:hypothetical protein